MRPAARLRSAGVDRRVKVRAVHDIFGAGHARTCVSQHPVGLSSRHEGGAAWFLSNICRQPRSPFREFAGADCPVDSSCFIVVCDSPHLPISSGVCPNSSCCLRAHRGAVEAFRDQPKSAREASDLSGPRVFYGRWPIDDRRIVVASDLVPDAARRHGRRRAAREWHLPALSSSCARCRGAQDNMRL